MSPIPNDLLQSGIVQQVLNYCAVIQPVLNQLCTLVARDAFSQALVNLGLVNTTNCSESNHSTPNKTHPQHTPKHHSYKVRRKE